MRLRVGERVHEVSVQVAEGETLVVVDGKRLRARLEAAGPGRFVLHHGSGRDTLYLVRDGATVHLHWRGSAYRLLEEAEGSRKAGRGADSRLEAPMPGKVIAVRVRPGDEVKKGQELLVVEAMKMENALRAPREGRVRAVLAKAGDMVSPGTPLVELE